jgi:hypothetical protein
MNETVLCCSRRAWRGEDGEDDEEKEGEGVQA